MHRLFDERSNIRYGRYSAAEDEVSVTLWGRPSGLCSWARAGDGRSPGKSDFPIPVFVMECPNAAANIEGQVTHVKSSVG
jgi:hypothetical protein